MKKLKYQNRYFKKTFKLKTTLNGAKQKNRKPYSKLIKKENLQDALDVALADTQTVYYTDDTSLDELETV